MGERHQTLNAPRKTVRRARKLRREMSLPEVLLWRVLKTRPGGFKFRRQHPNDLIVCDFACMSARLIIEIDGESHDMGDQPERDEKRDAWLVRNGYRTLRISAREVLKNMDGVVESIVAKCGGTVED
ncbi:MAG: endonuclease domain-containing protein [Sphingomonadaceae bacterium]|nr:endonuclease domain-containing protein [Sphingomonadaceae bacterium]